MGPRVRRVLPAVGVVLAASLAACVPTDTTHVAEIDDGGDAGALDRPAPTFPDGEVPAALVAEGLAHDLSARPRDQDYWSPKRAEARCAADRIVAELGASRLVALGYRPGTPGASVNDLDLDDAERDVLVEALASCVDPVQAVGAILYGAGRIPARMASCMARGMGEAGARPILEAWAHGRAVDPFEEGSDLASLVLGHADVCISDTAFNWLDLRFPDEDPIINSDDPAGTRSSPYVDDARRRADDEANAGGSGGTSSTAPPATTAPAAPPADDPQS